MATLLGEAKIRLRPDTNGFSGEAKTGIDRAMGAIGGAIKKTFQATGVAAGGLFAASLKKGWDRLTAIEDAQAKLKGLGHEAGSVQQIMDDALASVKGTAFGLGDAATIAASTVAAGIKPGQDLERTLKNVADAATIGGSSMAEMGSIFNKVATADKAQADVLNQLADRGIPIFQLLADEMGVTGAEVSKLASEGKINFETFQSAMEAGMGGAALESANTTRGAIANFWAAAGRGGAAFLDAGIFPRIKELFQNAIVWADNAAPAMEKFGAKAGDALAGAIEKAPAIWGKVKGAMSTLQPVWESLRGTAGNFVQIAKDLGPVLGVAFGGALTIVAELLKTASPLLEKFTGWLKENSEIVLVVVGAWAAYRVATQLAAGAQLLLNAAMKANPIGLVVTALTALAAAAVYAWNNSETFRQVVTNAWKAVQEGAAWMWDNVLKPVFAALVVGWGAVATGVQWAWTTILKPTWDLIASVVTTLWNNVLMPIFGLIGSVFSAVLSGMAWAWNNVLAPVFKAVWNVVSFLWNSVLSPIFGAIGTAWSGLASGFKWVWDNVLDPVFATFKSVVQGVQTTFENVVAGIGKAWDTVKSLVSTPIKWVIDFVWNNGIRKAWNVLNNIWGGDDLGEIEVGFARGGVMPGYTPGRDVHKFYSPTGGILNLSGGEAVMRPEVTKALGVEGVNALNAAARSGGASAVQQVMQGMYDTQAAMNFADGGIIPFPGWLKAIAPDWMGDWVNKVNSNPHVETAGDLIKTSATKAWEVIKSQADKLVHDPSQNVNEYGLQDNASGQARLGATFGVGIGGLGSTFASLFGAVKRAFPQARLTSGLRNTPDAHGRGKAADIGGPYPAAFGSQYMADIAAWLYQNHKGSLYELIYNGVGKSVSNVKSGANLAYNAATQAQHRNHVHAAVYDQGGVLRPGFTMAHNKSGRPEGVLNAEQLEWLRLAASNERPLVDSITINPQSSDARGIVDEMMFELRKAKRGARV